MLGHIAESGIPDVTVLTGDIHSMWVADLKPDFDNPLSPSVGVELCGTSITSSGFSPEEQQALRPLLYASNPHISYLEAASRGYMTADITADRWVARLRTIDDVYDPRPTIQTRSEWLIERGSNTAVQTVGDPFN